MPRLRLRGSRWHAAGVRRRGRPSGGGALTLGCQTAIIVKRRLGRRADQRRAAPVGQLGSIGAPTRGRNTAMIGLASSAACHVTVVSIGRCAGATMRKWSVPFGSTPPNETHPRESPIAPSGCPNSSTHHRVHNCITGAKLPDANRNPWRCPIADCRPRIRLLPRHARADTNDHCRKQERPR